MESCKYIKNEVFIDRSKIIKIILVMTFIFCVLKRIFINRNPSLNCIIYSYFIVSSITVLVLLKQMSEFYSRRLIRIINICFDVIIVISVSGIILTRNSIYSEINYMFINWNISMAVLSCTIIIAVTINEYCFDRHKLNRMLQIGLALIVVLLGCSYLTEKFFLAKILFILLEIMVSIIITKYVLLYNLKNKSSLNMLTCCFIFSIIINILNIFITFNLSLDMKEILINLIELIHIVTFKILSNIVVLNLVKEPYNKKLKFMENDNEMLEELNSQIIIKNRKLEESIINLSNKEEIYSTFFKYMPHPVVIVSAENSRILFVNKKFLELIDVNNAKDIINKKIDNFIDCLDDRQNEIYDAILKYDKVTKFISIKYFEYDYRNKVLLIKDNTSKVEMEQIKKEIENKRNQENIRTQFLSSISHDLKTPINVIYSVSQLQKIYAEKEDIDSLRKYNSICKTNCFNLIKLTNNLIDNSKIISDYLSPRLKKSNVVEIVEDNVMALVEYVKCNNIDLVFDTNTEECYILIDEEFMQRIIINLISNAIKYNKENGKIEVVIYENENDVRISVKDNGIGMKEEFKEKAFERYASEAANEKYMKKSSGFGLFVVKQLVELQNGKIEIESKYNVGTNIIIIFEKDNEYEE